jgi:beta-ureidopropionase / N-carbamoyl-L-amino-acid hydrolase
LVSTQTNLKIDGKRFLEDFEALGEIGATIGGGITRLALSNEDLVARAWFADRIEEAGLWVQDDEVGNLGGILSSDNPDAKTLLIGSHLDTVPNGGRYDGAIGVLAGLECLRTIKDSGLKLNYDLEVINFTDEEGTWKSLLGSHGLIGKVSADDINDSIQDNGAFRAALFRAGILPPEIPQAKRDPDQLLGFLELHIEQGDKLHRAGIDIGIVKTIVGRTTFNLTFYGEASHAGTTTADKRRDALQGAAAFIILVHSTVTQEFPDGVVNCGHVSVKPDTFNVVPAEASLRVECRHPDREKLEEMEARIIRLARDCAVDYRLSVGSDRVLHREAEQMSSDFMKQIELSCQENNASYMDIVSYGGHDAQIINKIAPSAMIFLPSVDGISHNPKEFTEWHHVEKGANILLQTILHLTNH